MGDFVHLHTHTDYSLLDGAGRIRDYVAKCKSLGMKSMAITDHGNMFGSYEFYHECIKQGIKPIVGCEFYVCEKDIRVKDQSNSVRHHLILLAKNEKGFRNLLKLTSIAYVDGFYMKPRIDKDLMREYREGLVCLSACLAGEVPRRIYANFLDKKKDLLEGVREICARHEEIYGKGNYFLEIQRHYTEYYGKLDSYAIGSDEYESISMEMVVNKQLVRLSKETGIPLVATNDAHYVNREDAEAQDILVSIGTGKTIKDPKRFKFFGDSFYFKSEEEMRSLFADIPEVVANASIVDGLCQLKIDYPGPILPKFEIPDKFANDKEYLIHVANEGFVKRYGEKAPDEYRKRLDYELSVINRMDFPGYYLIVWDYVRWAKDNGVPVGPGRGSGAGSIVAYCMEITDIDPMKYGLMFERFLNPERISMPDFDIDFCADKRQRVIDYVTEKYGSEKVGQICTFGTLKAKQCITDVARVLDIPLYEVNAMKKIIIDDLDLEFDWLVNGHVRKDGSKYARNEDFLKFREKGPEYEKLFEIVPKLEGMARNVSLHAAGVVIGKSELSDYVPLYCDNKSGSVATQYPMTQIEDCGLVKMDFLGLKTLTLLSRAEEFIRQRDPNFTLGKIEDEDPLTIGLFGRADTSCVFQFESSGMKGILKSAKPKNIKELAALNALYRPGPMANIPQYIQSKNDTSKIKYPFPELEDILAETFGVIVYQEQVMMISSVFAGYSNGKADVLRKIMGKKQKDKLEGARKEFIESSERNGKKREDAESLFDLLEPFAGYGFNKSHAVGYAFLAYQAGYLKAHYPVEFMAANLLMAAKDSNPDKLPETLMSAREMGIEVLAADVNLSEKTFSVSDGKIIYGLSGLKNVGEKFVENIIEERRRNGKYKDLVDFLTRLDSKTTNQRIVFSLIEGGALDSFGMSREMMERNYKRACDHVEKRKGKKDGYGASENLFSLEPSAQNNDIFNFNYLEPDETWTKQEKLRREWDILGTYVSGHPLDEYKRKISRCIRSTLKDAKANMPDGTAFDTICIVTKVAELSTKTGRLMGKLTISDYTSSAELIVWSRDWDGSDRGLKGRIEEMGVYCFEVVKKDDGDRTSLVFKSLKRIDELPETRISACKVVLGKNRNKESLTSLKDFLKLQKGGVRVSFIVDDGKNEKEYSTDFFIDDSDEMFDEIAGFPCVEGCRLM